MPRRKLSASAVADAPDPYHQFLNRKAFVAQNAGRDVPDDAIHASLFPFQRDLTRWALRKGRGAIYADTGLGKSRMQIEWMRLSGERGLIVAPLAVVRQTMREAQAIGVELVYARRPSEVGLLTITNYEMADKIEPQQFGAVVLDEAGILKNFAGAMRHELTDMFCDTPWKLCCTATPCPNEVVEITNQAEFLGVMKGREVLSMFFKHVNKNEGNQGTGTGWRMKRHAEDAFYRWMASWAMSVKKPSDLGYEDDGFILPPLRIEPVIVDCDSTPVDRLFFTGLKGIQDRVAVRRSTLTPRVEAAANLINSDKQPWVAWCGLNAEAEELHRMVPGSVNVEGSMPPEQKADLLQQFTDGRVRVLITKVAIAGFGMNMQHCARQVFVGLSDSFESYYQAIRRCWRFGQTREVIAYIVLSEPESEIHANVLRKEQEWDRMSRGLVAAVAAYEREELAGVRRRDVYTPAQPIRLPAWMKGNGNGSH